jgi:uncharacterized integral membrane protein
MTEQPEFPGATTTMPPQSANGTSPQLPPPARPPASERIRTWISSLRTSLIAAVAAVIVGIIFIIQNARPVNIGFLGAYLHLSLAVALLLAAIGGALTMVAAGPARITELRRIMRRDRREPPAS